MEDALASNFWASTFVWALVLGVIPGIIAKKKGYNFWAWWLFGAALFIVALIIILAREPNPAVYKRCPYCRQVIDAYATVCPHCQQPLGYTHPQTPQYPQQIQPPPQRPPSVRIIRGIGEQERKQK